MSAGQMQNALCTMICADPRGLGFEADTAPEDLSVRLAVPSHPSGTGRVRYEIGIRGELVPRLVAQVALQGRDELAGQNPYVPAVRAIGELHDLLPLPAGCFTVGERKVYWAAWNTWPALTASDGEVPRFQAVFRRLRSAPWWPARADDAADQRVHACIRSTLERCAGPANAESAAGLASLAQTSHLHFAYGFSHGDLWHQDILVGRDGRLCLLDWEWASDSRVAGTDLFEFAMSAIGVRHRCVLDAALTRLLWGGEVLESAFREELRVLMPQIASGRAEAVGYALAWLSRLNDRLCMQEPRWRNQCHPEIDAALSILASSSDYLDPLISGLVDGA